MGYLTKTQRSTGSQPRQIRLFQGRLTQADPLTSQELRFRNKQVSTSSFGGHLWLVRSTQADQEPLALPKQTCLNGVGTLILARYPTISTCPHAVNLYSLRQLRNGRLQQGKFERSLMSLYTVQHVACAVLMRFCGSARSFCVS